MAKPWHTENGPNTSEGPWEDGLQAGAAEAEAEEEDRGEKQGYEVAYSLSALK